MNVSTLSDMKMYQDTEKYTEKLYEEEATIKDSSSFFIHDEEKEGDEKVYGYE